MRVRVATYNVLSSHLADPSHFTRCAPADLDAAARLPRVLAKLRAETAAKSVIALQEVSMDWAGSLHAFFAAEGYHLVTALYGRHFNGYMGVALAWPTAEYEVSEVKIARMADTRAWPREEARGGARGRGALGAALAVLRRGLGALFSLVGLGGGGGGGRKRGAFGGGITGDPLAEARFRSNQAIAAVLVPKTQPAPQPFVVGCYHMPCLFRTVADRQVMMIHAALCAQWVGRLAVKHAPAGGEAEAAAHVLMGDFNFVPGSPSYQLLSGTGPPAEHPERPPLGGGTGRAAAWTPDALPGGALASAYALHGGKEPDFTNNAWVGEGPLFRETLDYIWLSRGWAVDGVRELPTAQQAADAPYPSAHEPSDHVLIGADLRF